MTRPQPAVIAAAKNASERMADRHTPFVMNDWYVAAFAEEIKDQLLARTLFCSEPARGTWWRSKTAARTAPCRCRQAP